jgi:RNA polymerase sigma factor (sigma-70 family)
MFQATSVYSLLRTDPGAGFKQLYLYQKGIRSWLKQNSAGHEECKDVFHDAMIAFYEYAQRKDFKVDINPEQLLFGIAKNIWFKELRKKKNIPSGELTGMEFSDAEMEDILQRENQYKAAGKALSELGSKCRQLLFLYYFRQQSLEKIAKRLGFSNANVAKTIKYQCLAKAKNLIFK